MFDILVEIFIIFKIYLAKSSKLLDSQLQVDDTYMFRKNFRRQESKDKIYGRITEQSIEFSSSVT